MPPPTHWKITLPTLCIQVYVISQVCAHNGEERRTHIGLDLMLMTPILVPILVGAGIASATAIGTSALTVGNQNFTELSSQTDLGLDHLENSLSRLES